MAPEAPQFPTPVHGTQVAQGDVIMRTFGILSASLFLLACGGSIGESPTPQPVPVEGSFDLTFATVTPTEQPNGPPISVPKVTSPSVGAKARLDVRAVSGGYEAVLTPRWGAPAAMAVVATSAELRLTGEVNVNANANANGGAQGVSDRWTTLVLPRRADGSLTGQASLAGDEDVFEGDVGWMYKVSATASFKQDDTVPDFKLASSGSAAGKYLPWDHVRMMASEPVDAPKFLSSTSAVVGSRTASFRDATVDFYNAAGALWAGSTSLDGAFGSWNFGATTGTLALGPGVPDRAGNARAPDASPQNETLVMLDVGAPASGFAFDGKDDAAPGTWGLAAIASGGACEGGGCLALGPEETNQCAHEGPGFAGRLKPGGTSLRLRFRVRAASLYQGGPVMSIGSLLRVETVRPGGAVKTTDVATPELAPLKDGDPLDYASSWSSATADLPPGSGEVGFAVRLVDAPYGCGGPAPAPMKVQVWVDAVHAE